MSTQPIQARWRRARPWLAALLGGLAAAAGHAQVYDFDRCLSGGGGGQDPARRALAQSMGAHVCLGVSPGAEPGSVRFAVWSRIPQAHSRIGTVAFDLGRHAGLIDSVAVALASPGLQAGVAAPRAHPFLRGMTPEFQVDVAQAGHLRPQGFGPGRMLAVQARLGAGRTYEDVLRALHEGLDPVGGATGLRVGVIVLYLLGGPPPGVATIQDDGGFVTAQPSAACR